MRLLDVDGEKRDSVCVGRGEIVERPNLGAEGRSSERAEDERDWTLGIELREAHRSLAVDERQFEVGCGVAHADLRRPQVEVLRIGQDLVQRLRLRHPPHRRLAAMTRFLHTMYRITDPEKSRAFYEALGMELRRDMDIFRHGEKEATNYFFGIPGQEEEIELTFNHDGRTYDVGTGYGHIALAVDDLEETLAELKEQGIEPEREPYRVREGGSLLCFVRDPDDYRIELIDRSGK